MTEPFADVSGWLLGLRDPLARIELALRRLEADGGAVGPGAVWEIRSAVGDADARLEAALRALRGALEGGERLEDCRAALVQLAQRVRGVLAARGCALRVDPVPEPVTGEPTRVRRGALCLLRAASAWAGAGGVIRISLAQRLDRYGLHLLATPGERSTSLATEPLARFALAVGAELGVEQADAGGLRLALWLPRRCRS